jgi:hypothetical protein
MNKPKVTIQIGHCAYRGANAMKFCFSRAQAVRELRARGVLRDVARDAVNKACGRVAGYQMVCVAKYGDVIEINNRTHDAHTLVAA